jgi:RNA polymerase subunit RPABC4/transcription elongation factor Spt4
MDEKDYHSDEEFPQQTSEVAERLRALESKIDGLVPHVLQLENAAIFIVGLMVLLQVLDTLRLAEPHAEIAKIYWFVPYAALFLMARVIKVRNPYNRFVEVVEKGFSYTGTGALAGGSITGLISGGLGAPVGAAMGGGIGFVTGVVVGIFKTKGNASGPKRIVCQKCKSVIKSTDKFCEKCGEPQTLSSTKCLKCDATISVHAQFCPNCGTPQGVSDASPPTGNDASSDPTSTQSDQTQHLSPQHMRVRKDPSQGL